VGLAIPAIGVEETLFEQLSLSAAGELDPPADFAHVGWFAAGPVPGDPGPAVIAGHVDSRSGPAVFFKLRDLRPGDAVTVRRSDGKTVAFTVDSVQRYPKNAFPTNAVYGPTPGSALRLITCGGSFDPAKRSYRDNVVVYASTTWASSGT
jgi:sortase (surface protein transpeptidase)